LEAKDNSDKPKKYILVEFPYPSGSGLHMGHAFTFTGGDVYARYLRMKGENVLFPMGWDAFGLPTENYAIKTKRKPQEVTKENTEMFKSQMKKLAFSFDWSREVNTTDADYYKWTQWIFIKLFEKGLAVKEEMPINWCPECKIGLANEEVVEGKCERCGAQVSRRNISQWIVKITKYAERLLSGLEETDFIQKVKAAQINWIGKSEGAKVKFLIQNPPVALKATSSLEKGGKTSPFNQGEMSEGQRGLDYLEVFTTRPDTLYGATFMVVAPEHELVEEILQNLPPAPPLKKGGENSPFIKGESGEAEGDFDLEAIKGYVKEEKKKSEMERTELSKEKSGVFSGLYAINPVNGKEIPIWISDFVLASYGTGAIMSVPGHDERDFDFAKKYNLPIIFVVEGQTQGLPVQKKVGAGPYEEAKGKLVNSGDWDGLEVPKDYEKILAWIEEKKIGERAVSYHLRDWIFSRQHYWGEPIPMIFCPACAKASAGKEKCAYSASSGQGWMPVPETELPVVLPEVEAYEPTDDGKSPLSKIEDWVKTSCPKCGGEAKRETDTMPNWAGSDWYFLRYIDPLNKEVLASMSELKKWLPVDVYIGGDEHNTLHLLYSRFIYQFLHDLGVVPENIREPYYKRLSHGVILAPDNQRMSKSKGNVVVPEIVSDKYGVDALRLYLMFMGPFDGTMAWNENTLMGVKRFLDKFDKYMEKNFEQVDKVEVSEDKALVILNKLIKGIGEDYEEYKFNTAVAKLMEALNHLMTGNYLLAKADLLKLVKTLAPLAPYMSEEWWNRLAGEGKSVHVSRWPEVEEKYLIEEKVKVAVAINGKVRVVLEIDKDEVAKQEVVIKKAMEEEKVSKWLQGKKIVKEIYVPGKMLNLVISG
jgi:leucyl-tRNA synthetase